MWILRLNSKVIMYLVMEVIILLMIKSPLDGARIRLLIIMANCCYSGVVMHVKDREKLHFLMPLYWKAM